MKKDNEFVKQLYQVSEKKITVTVSSYPSTEEKYKLLKASGLKISKSEIYRNAIDALYADFEKKKKDN